MKPEKNPSYSESTYLLLDGLAMDVPFTAYSLDDHPVTEPLFRQTRHAAVIEASPWLVKPSAQGRLLQSSEVWRPHGVLIHSGSGMQMLAEHLRSLISIRLPSHQLAYCRFYAPDWTGQLFQSMDSSEFEAWSGPIKQWEVFDGQWRRYGSNLTGKPRQANEEGWYMLREQQLKQWEADEYRRFVDHAIMQMGCHPEQPHYLQQRQLLEHLIQRAHGYGFKLEHQVSHYLELACRFPQELDSPYWHGYLGDQIHSAEQRLHFTEQQLFGMNKDV